MRCEEEQDGRRVRESESSDMFGEGGFILCSHIARKSIETRATASERVIGGVADALWRLIEGNWLKSGSNDKLC